MNNSQFIGTEAEDRGISKIKNINHLMWITKMELRNK